MNYLKDKLANKGADALTDAELLAIVINNEPSAEAIIRDFGGYKGMANQPLERFLKYPGLGDATIIRMAACFEFARRVVHQVLEMQTRDKLF